MISSERINVVLKKLGVPHRAQPGGLIDDRMAHMLEALPTFIEKLVKEELARQKEQADD